MEGSPNAMLRRRHCAAGSQRGQDAFLAFADGLGRGDEGLEPDARRLRAEAVDEEADVFFCEVDGFQVLG